MNNTTFINSINDLDEMDLFIKVTTTQIHSKRKILLDCVPSIKEIEFVVNVFQKKQYVSEPSAFTGEREWTRALPIT